MKGIRKIALLIAVFLLVAVFTMSALAKPMEDPTPTVRRGAAVAELASMALLAGGSICLLARRRRDRR